jgi:hypothetical protein
MLRVKFQIRGRDYFITSDENQYILSRSVNRKNRKTGKGYVDVQVLGYHPHLPGLFTNLLNYSLRYENCKTIKELHDTLEKTYQEINSHWDTSFGNITDL